MALKPRKLKPPSMQKLRREAGHSAAVRGHRMKWRQEFDSRGRLIHVGQCLYCDEEVMCLQHPDANEVHIGGKALALQCEMQAQVEEAVTS